jgi:CheY-like chemotaxis protein
VERRGDDCVLTEARCVRAHPFPNGRCRALLEGVVESGVLAGRCILVVEDEPLISFDVTARLQDAGARVVSAHRLEKALRLADCPELAAGVLDFDLGKEDSTPVCRKLVDRRIPFVFHSGRMYSAFRQWPRAPVILKPTTQALIGAVASLIGSARS